MSGRCETSFCVKTMPNTSQTQTSTRATKQNNEAKQRRKRTQTHKTPILSTYHHFEIDQSVKDFVGNGGIGVIEDLQDLRIGVDTGVNNLGGGGCGRTRIGSSDEAGSHQAEKGKRKDAEKVHGNNGKTELFGLRSAVSFCCFDCINFGIVRRRETSNASLVFSSPRPIFGDSIAYTNPYRKSRRKRSGPMTEALLDGTRCTSIVRARSKEEAGTNLT